MAAEIKFQIINSSTQAVQFAASDSQGFATTPAMNGQVLGGQTLSAGYDFTLTPGDVMQGSFTLTLSSPPYAAATLDVRVQAVLVPEQPGSEGYRFTVDQAWTGFQAYGGLLTASIGASAQQQQPGQPTNVPHDGYSALATIQISPIAG